MVSNIICKGCNKTFFGSTQVERIEIHKGLCRDCRNDPYGIDRQNKLEEVCPTCSKKWRDH